MQAMQAWETLKNIFFFLVEQCILFLGTQHPTSIVALLILIFFYKKL